MVVLNRHLDDGRVVLGDPLPEHLPEQARVRVVIEGPAPAAGGGDEDVLAKIAAMACEMDLPADYAAQHHHYTDGVPKR